MTRYRQSKGKNTRRLENRGVLDQIILTSRVSQSVLNLINKKAWTESRILPRSKSNQFKDQDRHTPGKRKKAESGRTKVRSLGTHRRTALQVCLWIHGRPSRWFNLGEVKGPLHWRIIHRMWKRIGLGYRARLIQDLRLGRRRLGVRLGARLRMRVRGSRILCQRLYPVLSRGLI